MLNRQTYLLVWYDLCSQKSIRVNPGHQFHSLFVAMKQQKIQNLHHVYLHLISFNTGRGPSTFWLPFYFYATSSASGNQKTVVGLETRWYVCSLIPRLLSRAGNEARSYVSIETSFPTQIELVHHCKPQNIFLKKLEFMKNISFMLISFPGSPAQQLSIMKRTLLLQPKS